MGTQAMEKPAQRFETAPNVADVAARLGVFLAHSSTEKLLVDEVLDDFLSRPGNQDLVSVDPRYLLDALDDLELATYVQIDRRNGLLVTRSELLRGDLLIEA
jgi:hypothetical protein